MIEMRGLVVGYPNKPLTIPIKCDLHHTIGVLGRNGCGKSTLLRSIAGAIPLLAGDVYIAGASIRREAIQAKMSLGYMADRLPVPDSTTVAELLMLVAWSRRCDSSEVDHVCEYFCLQDIRQQRLGQSSLGQQRRSCLAASAIGRPLVLMLDEPSVGMDAASRQLLVDYLLQRKQANQTSIIISHDRDFLTLAQAETINFSDWQLPA